MAPFFNLITQASPLYIKREILTLCIDCSNAIAILLKMYPMVSFLYKNLFLAGLVVFLFSCNQKVPVANDPLFEAMEKIGIDFINPVKNTVDFNIFSYRNFYNGGGVAIGDINNDGLPDIYFSANMGSNKLYLNKGNWQFEDITEKAGLGLADKWSTGVVMADINSDSLLDIYVCNAGFQTGMAQDNSLFINNGDGSFTEQASVYGLADAGYTTHAAFFDYDLDGDLDCYMLNNSFIPVNTLNYSNKRDLRAEDWPVADFLKGGGDRLLENKNGKYVDVSKKAGILSSLIGFGLGVTVGDINGDRYPDIYVSNDFYERDYLYINQHNGTFKESLEQFMGHTSLSSMGADMADINNDGYPDLFVTDMLPDDDFRLKTTSSFENYDTKALKEKLGFYHQYMQNTLQLNNHDGGFDEIARYSGIAASDWSWGGLVFDADNDGWSDLFVCNGIYQDVTDQDFIDFFANDIIQRMVMTGKKDEVEEVISKMPSRPIANKAFRNLGNLKFQDIGNAWGFTEKTFSNGAAYGDLDGDGDLDLVINNLNQPALIYKNKTSERKLGNSIRIDLRAPAPNTYAIGACVQVFQGKEIRSRELIPTRGFQSSCDYPVYVGLDSGKIDSIKVLWPNLSITTLINPAADKPLKLSQPDPGSGTRINASEPSALFVIKNSLMEAHQEDAYVDFYYERNIPKMMSHEGPATAFGDINGDGLTDVFIGGALNKPGHIYLQTIDGFKKATQPALETDAYYEDVTAIFFDANGDGKTDLMIGSGGNHIGPNDPEMQNRLYLNDGKGTFERSRGNMPLSQGNTAVLVAEDWDGDGDLDVFVGSRSVPRQYGIAPPHYFLQNDGKGKFTDITATVAPEMNQSGMITDAIWVDVTGDNKAELVTTGDWNAPMVWEWQKNKFTLLQTNLSDYSGWWLTLSAADLDGDGKKDLILGNQGENFYVNPTMEDPCKLWVGDFDGNGLTDKIITSRLQQKDKPVFLKREMTDQLPYLKKQNIRHEAYANKDLNELIGEAGLKNAKVWTATWCATSIAWNEGNGVFTMKKLPPNMQFSSTHAFSITDVNKDGLPDLLSGGNDFSYLPQFSQQDASRGNLLINRGKRNFEWIEPRTSGLKVEGEIRHIEKLTENLWLVVRNNRAPVFLERTH